MKKFILIFSLFISLYTSAQERIQMQVWKGVYTIPCTVNGLKLRFVFDTGAAAVSISAIEATFMLKNEYLSEDDIIGTQEAILADGSVSENVIINLKEIKIGSKILKDVKALVSSSQEAPLLLGQSAISLLGKWQMSDDTLILGDSAPAIPQDIDAAVKQYETRGDLASAYNLLKNAIVQDDYKSYEKWISFVKKNMQLLHTAKVEIDDDLLAQLLFEAVMANYAPLVSVFKENTYYPFSSLTDKTKMLYFYEALFNKGYHVVGKHIAEAKYLDNSISFENYIYYLEQSAKEGDVSSYMKLGSAYSNYKLINLYGAEVNITKSLYWYKKAADSNDLDGQCAYAIAILMMENPSSEQKLSAISYLKKAAINGHTGAISELVREYYYGFHVAKNIDTALFWAKKLEYNAEYKWWAHAFIGFIYDEKGDTEKTVSYLEKAVEYKWDAAAIRYYPPTHTYGTLGEMYYLGHGVKKDYDRALKLLLKEIEMSDHEDVVYCYSLVGSIYDIYEDYARAMPYVKYAAEHDNAYSQSQIARYYALGDTTEGVDEKKAEQWAQKAINNKNATNYILGYSYRLLGLIYSSSDSKLYDIHRALQNYEKSSSYGDKIASYNLGEIYENGEGSIDKNFKLAEKYYRLAAEQGYEKAKEKLRLFQ